MRNAFTIPAQLSASATLQLSSHKRVKREHEDGDYARMRKERGSGTIVVAELREAWQRLLLPIVPSSSEQGGNREVRALEAGGVRPDRPPAYLATCSGCQAAQDLLSGVLRDCIEAQNWGELWVLLGQIDFRLTHISSPLLPWWVRLAPREMGSADVQEQVDLVAGEMAGGVDNPLDVDAATTSAVKTERPTESADGSAALMGDPSYSAAGTSGPSTAVTSGIVASAESNDAGSSTADLTELFPRTVFFRGSLRGNGTLNEDEEGDPFSSHPDVHGHLEPAPGGKVIGLLTIDDNPHDDGMGPAIFGIEGKTTFEGRRLLAISLSFSFMNLQDPSDDDGFEAEVEVGCSADDGLADGDLMPDFLAKGGLQGGFAMSLTGSFELGDFNGNGTGDASLTLISVSRSTIESLHGAWSDSWRGDDDDDDDDDVLSKLIRRGPHPSLYPSTALIGLGHCSGSYVMLQGAWPYRGPRVKIQDRHATQSRAIAELRQWLIEVGDGNEGVDEDEDEDY